jgi:hypothetical protein
LLGSEGRLADVDFRPRLFFFDSDLWETTAKLKAQAEQQVIGQRTYAEDSVIKAIFLRSPSAAARVLASDQSEFASAIGAISVAAAHSANNEAKAVLAAVQDQLQNYAQVHHALQLPEDSSCIDVAAYLQRLCQAISRSKLDRKGI